MFDQQAALLLLLLLLLLLAGCACAQPRHLGHSRH
jgi:hypothetical protein